MKKKSIRWEYEIGPKNFSTRPDLPSSVYEDQPKKFFFPKEISFTQNLCLKQRFIVTSFVTVTHIVKKS